jgi:hypothetical protein
MTQARKCGLGLNCYWMSELTKKIWRAKRKKRKIVPRKKKSRTKKLFCIFFRFASIQTI